jgi:4-amino-4-deoxy-L-arabinose transferase-like glycosyltransferase
MFLFTEKFSQVKKILTLSSFLAILLLVILYFITRLINIHGLPAFTDEGIYINWAKIAWHDPNWRFISLVDGKQPLQTWLTIPLLKLFPSDALVAGRLFGVFSGFTALIGMITLNWYLFGKRAGFIAGLLYIFTPYFLFYDRMALVDSLVNSGFIWTVFFSVLLARTVRLDVALIFGMITGVFLLAKSSVLLFVGMSLFACTLLVTKNSKNQPQKSSFFSGFFNFCILFCVSSGVAFAIYNIQRLSPYFSQIAEKNKTFILTPGEWLGQPFSLFIANIREIPVNVIWEAGFLIVIFAVLGAVLLYKTQRQLFIYLFLLFLLPFIVISFFNKIAFPRYLTFFVSLMVIFASYWFSQIHHSSIKEKFAAFFKHPAFHIAPMVVLGVLITFQLFFDFFILFDVKNALLPPVDRGQYIVSENATWGLSDLMSDMRQKATQKPILLVTEGDFGLIGDVVRIYDRDDDNIEVRGVWPLDEKAIQQARTDAEKQGKQVFFVSAHRESFPGTDLKEVQEYKHPVGDKKIVVFD